MNSWQREMMSKVLRLYPSREYAEQLSAIVIQAEGTDESMAALAGSSCGSGFSIRVQSPAGIRFKSGIDAGLKRQLTAGSVDGCRLKEYGTLFITDENRKKLADTGTSGDGENMEWSDNYS